MAEEVKKAPKPVDPNSAKYKLGKIAADAYVDAIEAKKRGEKVAWVSSNFPVEIPETMGIATVYPENQAAGIAARGADFADERLARLFVAVEHGDTCALPGEVSADRAAQNPGPTRHNDDTAPDVKEIFHVFQMILFL